MTLILASLWKNSATDILEVPEEHVLNYGDHVCFIAGFHVSLCEEKTISSKKTQINKREYKQVHKTIIIAETTLAVTCRKCVRSCTAKPM